MPFNRPDSSSSARPSSAPRGRGRGRGRGLTSYKNQSYSRNNPNQQPNQSNFNNNNQDNFQNNNKRNYNNNPRPANNKPQFGNYSRSNKRQGSGTGQRFTGLKFANMFSYVGQSNLGHSGTCLAIWPQQNKIFTGGDQNNVGCVKMFDFNGDEISLQNEGQSVSKLIMTNNFLFIAFIGPAGPGTTASFIKSYDFNNPEPVIASFELSPQFPAAHEKRVSDICVNNNLMISSSEDTNLRVWSLNGPKWDNAGAYLNPTPAPIVAAACGNGLTAAATASELRFFDAMGGNLITTYAPKNREYTCLKYWESSDMKVLLAGSRKGSLDVFDLTAVSPNGVEVGFSYDDFKRRGISSLAVGKTKKGDCLFVGMHEGSVQVFEIPSFEEIGYLRGHRRTSAITDMGMHENTLFVLTKQGNMECYTLKP